MKKIIPLLKTPFWSIISVILSYFIIFSSKKSTTICINKKPKCSTSKNRTVINQIFLCCCFFIVFTSSVTSQVITVDATTYTIQQLVEDILINSTCAQVSNFTSFTGSIQGFNGIGYFEANGTSFEIDKGVILSTGNAISAVGPNGVSPLSDGSGSTWPGDVDLSNITATPLLSNASYIQFDFIPTVNFISFDFLFASEEYTGSFPCDYSDVFAFILTDSMGVSRNLAVIPGTNIPIKVTTVNEGVLGVCVAQNPSYYNKSILPGTNAPIDFNGYTKVLTASGTVIPNNTYTIKLVIADNTDSAFDSAVFLAGGTFNIGGLAGTDGNLTICEGDIVTESQLFASLGGSPQTGGTWSPVLAGSGTYTYTITTCSIGITSNVDVAEIATPDKTLSVSDSTVCINTDATILITAAENGVNYEVLLSGAPLTPPITAIGSGTDLSFTIPAAQFSNTDTTYSISAYRSGCTSVLLDDTAQITINNTLPVWAIAPTDITVECGSSPDPKIQFANWLSSFSGTHSCGTTSVTNTSKGFIELCGDTGTETVTFVLSEPFGNSISQDATFNVVDLTPPEFVESLPQDTFAFCEEIPKPQVLTATDICEQALVTFSEIEKIGDCSHNYTIIRTWTATDPCTNKNTHVQTIKVACHVKTYNAISVPQNGANDLLLFSGIDCYPNNNVTVFNRWGVQVYQTNGYNNGSKSFRGYYNSKREPLPTGTYFYILEYEYSDDIVSSKVIKQSGHLYLVE